jgi:hypothetical protein
MIVLRTAMHRIFATSIMSVATVWISATTSEERPIRVILSSPNRITEAARTASQISGRSALSATP